MNAIKNIAAVLCAVFLLSGCATQAEIRSRNLASCAERFPAGSVDRKECECIVNAQGDFGKMNLCKSCALKYPDDAQSRAVCEQAQKSDEVVSGIAGAMLSLLLGMLAAALALAI